MSEAAAPAPNTPEPETPAPETPAPKTVAQEWTKPVLLMLAALASTTYVGALNAEYGGSDVLEIIGRGYTYSIPLMAILMSHEFGHYIAGRIHGVDISPPFFIPLPVAPIGTMGAVIRMRGAIKTKNALLDIGAAGPLAGVVVALPALVYGVATSPIKPLPDPEMTALLIEGHSLLYGGLLAALKDIPPGHDILLNNTAWAGWVGLLVTMINLIPFGQLDGGHVAYALFGKRQDRGSRRVLFVLPVLGLAVWQYYGDIYAGAPWFTWTVMLLLLSRMSGIDHPPTSDEPLSPKRRAIALLTLGLFVLLFMPAWLRPA